MGRVALSSFDSSFWHDRSVLVTGHTGFKGGWLTTWLAEMGARVTGCALPPESEPSYFQLCALDRKIKSLFLDIRDLTSLDTLMRSAEPEIVFHLSAQALVRRSYRQPLETFATNVIGTANVLEAARESNSVRAIVIVTSDKCYENHELSNSYREEDPLGGRDPYSASKGCAEIVAAAYRRSFFDDPSCPVASATVRAGNVIGGGDWAEDRLVPDAIRALCGRQPLALRHPGAIRPWQHVLEPLRGYLMLGERLCTEGKRWSGPWNFGPDDGDIVTTAGLVDGVFREWGAGSWRRFDQSDAPVEANTLRLDCAKARELLGWRPILNYQSMIKFTVDWYRRALQAEGRDMFKYSVSQIRQYSDLAQVQA